MSERITISVPGEPHAQGRPRATVVGGFARVYDPQNSRQWKAVAQHHMRIALGDRPPLAGPVAVSIVARFSCPKSEWRTKAPRPARRHTKRPDADNIAKAALDSALGVLFCDDAQVCVLRIEKWIAAQGEAPGIEIDVMGIEDMPPTSGGRRG